MSSGVVGLVGVPVKVTYDENATPILTFYYDEDELSDFSVENEKTISTEYMICEKDHNDGWVGKVEVRYIE